MAYKDRDTLFIFLDESGNLDFSSTGTAYWSLTAVCTLRQPMGGMNFPIFCISLPTKDLDKNASMQPWINKRFAMRFSRS